MLVFLGVLCLLQVFVLSTIRTGTSYDGAEQLLYTQSLEWGYGRSQPPLYTWLLIGIQQLIGVNQFSENLLKFSLLFALFFLMWRIALRLGFKAATASTLAVSPFLVIEIGWEVQRNYSHSVLLLALTAAFALCYLRARAMRSTGGYVALGLIFGLMLLTKYNAVLFVLALVVADLLALRRDGVFASWKAAAIPLIAAVLVTPHALWALDNANHVLALTNKFAIAAPGGGITARAQGLLAFAVACASIVAIPALMAGLHRGWAIAYPDPHGTKRVFVLWSALAVVFGLILVLASGTTNVNVRWMLPLAIPALQVICGVVCDAKPQADRHFRFLAITLAVLATAGQWIESWTDKRKGYDYGELMKVVAETTGASELLINDYAVLANLRLVRSPGPRSQPGHAGGKIVPPKQAGHDLDGREQPRRRDVAICPHVGRMRRRADTPCLHAEFPRPAPSVDRPLSGPEDRLRLELAPFPSDIAVSFGTARSRSCEFE